MFWVRMGRPHTLSAYACRRSAHSFHIRTLVVRKIWCRFNSFCFIAAVVECIQPVFLCKTYLSGATQALESALFAQTTQKCGRTNWATNQSHNPCCAIAHGVITRTVGGKLYYSTQFVSDSTALNHFTVSSVYDNVECAVSSMHFRY